MSDSDFPINPEDRPGDTTNADADRAAWKADADRFVAEEVPKMIAAIQGVRDGTETLRWIGAKIDQVLPVLLGLADPSGASGAAALTDAKSGCQAVQNVLASLEGNLPGIIARMQGLLKKT